MANLQDIVNRSEVGAIKPWTKATAPDGYLLCDGSAVSRTTFADLFAVISTTYGVGNGSTTFNVPDLQGKFPQGKSGTTSLAGTGGANTVTVAVTNNQAVSSITSTATSTQSVTMTGNISNTSLTTGQLASHSHSLGKFDGQQGNSGSLGSGPGGNPSAPKSTGNTGSGSSHNHSHNLSGTLTGNISVTNSGGALTGNVTAAGTNSFSPFVIVNYIIKH
mgnify:FL=1